MKKEVNINEAVIDIELPGLYDKIFVLIRKAIKESKDDLELKYAIKYGIKKTINDYFNENKIYTEIEILIREELSKYKSNVYKNGVADAGYAYKENYVVLWLTKDFYDHIDIEAFTKDLLATLSHELVHYYQYAKIHNKYSKDRDQYYKYIDSRTGSGNKKEDKDYLSDEHEIMAFAKIAVEQLYANKTSPAIAKELLSTKEGLQALANRSVVIKMYLKTFNSDMTSGVLKKFLKNMYGYISKDIAKEKVAPINIKGLNTKLDQKYEQLGIELVDYKNYIEISKFNANNMDYISGNVDGALDMICNIADKYKRIITVTPQYLKVSKSAIIGFLKKHGFVLNSGRNKDYRINQTMYYKPYKVVTELDEIKAVISNIVKEELQEAIAKTLLILSAEETIEELASYYEPNTIVYILEELNSGNIYAAKSSQGFEVLNEVGNTYNFFIGYDDDTEYTMKVIGIYNSAEALRNTEYGKVQVYFFE